MPVILTDPNEAVCPDFASEEYAEVRNALVGENVDDATAVVMMTNVWNANNTADKARWARQRQVEREEEEERDARAREEQERRQEARELEEEAARAEEKKKHKTKYAEVNMQIPPPTTPPEILPAYAITRLQKGQYVELWYFTNKGLDYALKTASTVDENTLVQTVDKEGNATWVLATASRGSRAALDDRDLSWEQLMVAIPRFIDAIHTAKWTEQRQTAMASLFTSLQAHPLRFTKDTLDRTALLRYLSEQRRLWHQAIEAGTGAWNIGILSETLLRMAADTVRRENRDKVEAEWMRAREREDSERRRDISGDPTSEGRFTNQLMAYHIFPPLPANPKRALN